MKKLRVSVFLLLLLLAGAIGLRGQGGASLHLITCIDDTNDDVREGCQKDYEKATALFKAVAEDAGLVFRPNQLAFEQGPVEAFVEAFSCDANDVVVFLYSGHGFRYEDDGEEWRWPFLYLCNRGEGAETETCEVDLDWVQNTLVAKNPRLSITIGDSCNDVLDNPEANAYLASDAELQEDPDPNQANTFRNLELITRFRGHIIASASSPGQGSYTSPEEGSYFVNELFKGLYDAFVTSSQPTSWKAIFEKTKQNVRSQKPGQTPQYFIDAR